MVSITWQKKRVLRGEVSALAAERQEGCLLRRRRRRVQHAHQPLRLLLRQEGLQCRRNDPAGLRLLRPVLRHRPVPVGQGQIGFEILQILLELVEIGAMPGQEALPAVLAMVLVDQRLVVVAAPVLGPGVQIVEMPEGPAQPLDLRLAQAIEVGPLARLARAAGTAIDPFGKDRQIRHIRQPGLDRPIPGALQPRGRDAAQMVIARAAVVDPFRDEVDIAGPQRGSRPRAAAAGARRRRAPRREGP